MKLKFIAPIIISLIATTVLARPNFFQNRFDNRFDKGFRNQNNKPSSSSYQTLNINGQSRSYLVENNEKYSTKKRPLMIVLHGGGGNAEYSKLMSQFSQKARQENFVVIFPNGSGRMENKFLTWNATHCCGYAMREHIDDIGFINALIDKAISEYGVDPTRVYVSGMSNGAMMTHQLAMALPNKITAIGTVVGTMFGDEKMPNSPVPAVIINGWKDEMLPFNGGSLGKIEQAWDGTLMQPADYQAQFWAKADNCDSNPKTTESQLVITRNYNCRGTNLVRQIIVKDGTHAWYGGRKWNDKQNSPSNAINATDEIWNFVSQFKK